MWGGGGAPEMEVVHSATARQSKRLMLTAAADHTDISSGCSHWFRHHGRQGAIRLALIQTGGPQLSYGSWSKQP